MPALLNAVGQVIDCEDPSFLEPTPIGPNGIDILDCIRVSPDEEPLVLSLESTQEEHAALIDYLGSSTHSSPFPSLRPSAPMLSQVARRMSGSVLCERSSTTSRSHRSNSSFAFRQSQLDQWNQRYQDLVEFRNAQGHCLVPLKYPEHPSLARWIQRQRYQYRLKHDGKHSSLTDEREATLENLGFIWDSHGAAWEERWNELLAFRDQFGHCHVPAYYPDNPKLSIWVKFQRKQFKLLSSTCKRSRYGRERVSKLLHLGFVFDPRNTKKGSLFGDTSIPPSSSPSVPRIKMSRAG
jgi:hypothetical protein